MALPWYYLERPSRLLLLRTYYAATFFAYPTYVLLNWNNYIPTKADVFPEISLGEKILNSQDMRK